MMEYKPKENEIEAWTVAVGRIPLIPWKKGMREAIKLIKEQKGFMAVHPVIGKGTLLLFDSENNAKGARNVLRYHGVQCGNEICKVYVDKRYLGGSDGKK